MRKIVVPLVLALLCAVASPTLARTLRVVNFATDVPGITPLDQTFDPDSYSVIGQVFDSLVHINLDGKRVPALATSWKLVDSKAYGFTLKAISIQQAEPLSKAIAEDLAAVGVKLEIEFVSRPEWVRTVIGGKLTGNPYSGDMAINLVDNPVVDLAFQADLFLASSSPWSLVHDPTFDKKFKWALFMGSMEKHVKVLKALDKYIQDNAMMIFTFQPERVFGMKKDVTLPAIGINGHVDYYVFSRAR